MGVVEWTLVATVVTAVLTAIGPWNLLKRGLIIEEPANGEVYQEYSPVSGKGARAGWKVLVIHKLDRLYLQETAATANKDGRWEHEGCHYDNTAIGKHRWVYAVAVPSQVEVDAVAGAFGGWGRSGNHAHIAAKDLKKILNETAVPHLISHAKRVLRVR